MAQAFITRRGGGFGGVNQTLPEQITAFTATADSTPSITLNWINPTEYWAGTLIVKKAGSAPEGVNDGEKIYNGTGTTFTDTAVEYDTEYFYRAFPFNEKKQYQTEVLTVSAMPRSGLPLSELAEGALVSINEGGTAVPFYLAKHDYESGLNGAGRQLMVRKNCYDIRYWNPTNYNAYATSDIDAWQNNDYKALFSPYIQKAMGTTSFYYTIGNNNWNVTTLERSVFMLSVTEHGVSDDATNIEGTALPIADLLLTSVLDDGTLKTQWTRTPDIGNYRSAMYIYESSDGIKKAGSQGCLSPDTHASRPCFTLPATALVDPTPNADGSYNLIES